MNKKLIIPLLIFVAIITSIAIIVITTNNKKLETNPNRSVNTNQQYDNKEITMDKIYLNINDQKLEINLEDNSTTSALIEMLPLNLSMSDLNGNEKYAYLDESLPTNTYNPKRIEAGDVMLFGDDCLVIFYKSFDTNYSYSKIGHINNLPALGSEEISVYLSAE